MKTSNLFVLGGFLASISFLGFGCSGGGEGEIKPPPPVPAAYADKHMPDGWWSDPEIIEQGRLIFIGEENPDVNCASCHGKDGKPKKRGARDFRVQDRMKLYSDSTWFWRISEGVKSTKMKAWKEKLSEEDIWKVVAYEHTFSHEGEAVPHDDFTAESTETESTETESTETESTEAESTETESTETESTETESTETESTETESTETESDK